MTCPEHPVDLSLQQTDSAGQIEVALYRDADWPASQLTLGETALNYDTATGLLRQATVRLQAGTRLCSGTCLPNQTELQAVALHELGHALGLAHTSIAGAVMAASLQPGTGQGMTLTADDRLALCTAYSTQCRQSDCLDPGPELDVGFKERPADTHGCDASRKSCGAQTWVVGLAGLLWLIKRTSRTLLAQTVRS